LTRPANEFDYPNIILHLDSLDTFDCPQAIMYQNNNNKNGL